MRFFPAARSRSVRVARRGTRIVFPAVLLGAGATPAPGQPLHLGLVPDSSRVEYHITFSLSDVTNTAGPASGTVLATRAGGSDFFGIVSVDLRGLQTGIGRRDRHIRSADYLDTERYPLAELRIAEVVADSNRTPEPAATATNPAGSDLSARVHGTLDLHGVRRDVDIPVDLDWRGEQVRVRGRFPIRLADHAIRRPKRLLLATGESVEVRVDLLFVP